MGLLRFWERGPLFLILGFFLVCFMAMARLLVISIERIIRGQKRVEGTDIPRDRKGRLHHKSTILPRSKRRHFAVGHCCWRREGR